MPEVLETSESVEIPILARDGTVRTSVLIDATDEEFVGRWTWRMAGEYAGRTVWMRDLGRPRMIYMHRALLGLEHGDRRQVDHINRNRFDNRRVNLRIVTAHQNRQNVASYRGSRSAYRNVYWHEKRRCWYVTVQCQGRRTWGGYHRTEEGAAAAASALRERIFTHSVE